MTALEEYRQEINGIDREMADLFARRMAVAGRIAAYKQQNGLPVFDPAREQAVRDRAAAAMADDALRPYYVEFIQAVMDISKEYQRKLLGEER